MTRHRISRRLLLVSAAPVALSTTGCFGSFGLTTGLWEWNAHFANKWARWGIFIPFVLIPVVYSVAIFADMVVVNSIEFWTGKDPIPHPHRGKFKAARAARQEQRAEVRPTKNPDELQIVESTPEGERVSILRRNANGVELLDEQGRLMTRVRARRNTVVLEGETGEQLAHLDEDQATRMIEAHQEGHSITLELQDCLDESGQLGPVLAYRDTLQSRLGVVI